MSGLLAGTRSTCRSVVLPIAAAAFTAADLIAFGHYNDTDDKDGSDMFLDLS